MLKSKKHVFWEAFFITVVIFLMGLLIGVAIEASRLNDINEFYAQSEISLLDIFTFNDLLKLGKINCEIIAEENIKFADRIYDEARLLSKYSSSEKITELSKSVHKKYDLMRTLLWINAIEAKDKCSSQPITVVYLYELETEDLAQKATQNVWSKILLELKEKKGNAILLIPISVDNDIASLRTLIEEYKIEKYPVLISLLFFFY